VRLSRVCVHTSTCNVYTRARFSKGVLVEESIDYVCVRCAFDKKGKREKREKKKTRRNVALKMKSKRNIAPLSLSRVFLSLFMFFSQVLIFFYKR